MNARGWLVLILAIVLLAAVCRAAESPSKPIGTYSCADIRAAVALFTSVEAAVKAARAAGASDRQIEDAKRCLSS
jgi:hypothetical protein